MNLAKIQLLSVATKAITTVLGIVQALLVVHFLSKAEYGLVGLVMSIGSVVGVTQHLGVVDGAIREIAVLKRREEIGKVFWVSHLIRQGITLPLSLGLLLAASSIAVRFYGRPEIVPYIQIFAASLILQGLQDVLGATLTGMKRFGWLYIVQIATAIINIGAFGYLTAQYGIDGFFWALILTTSVMVVWYFAIISRALTGHLQWPTWQETRSYLRRLMRVAAFMYVARIFFVIWQRLPLLVLGAVLTDSQLGEINLSLTFGARLTIIAMALSEVNLSLMSSLFVNRRHEFAAVITKNMQRVLLLLLAITLGLLYFAPEILQIPILIEYYPARHLVAVMTGAFFLYALLDVGTSSIFVAANRPQWRASLYGIMVGITAVLLFWLLMQRPEPLIAGVALLAGSALSYGVMILFARRLGVELLTRQSSILLGIFVASLVWLLSEPSLWWRVGVFVVIGLYITLTTWRAHLLGGGIGRARIDEEQWKIICFAGAFFDSPTWTNRQHIMSRLATKHAVLYIEPRVWIIRFIMQHWRQPLVIARFCWRILWGEERQVVVDGQSATLLVKAQWNLLPGSRERPWISTFNHWLNRWHVLVTARLGGFMSGRRSSSRRTVMWLYDTEAAEYLSAFKSAVVVYDCVDDHAAQVGPDRNVQRVIAEEQTILKRADIVATTSQYLYQKKRSKNDNTHLVLNAADVDSFSSPPKAEDIAHVHKLVGSIARPIVGSVGALDSYKYDFNLLLTIAKKNPQWSFVFFGQPMVAKYIVAKRNNGSDLDQLATLPNVHIFGAVPHSLAPACIALFDVCIIPYRENAYNQASFPLKFWEFMATGKPIVATGVPELMSYENLIYYATGISDFETGIKDALRQPDKNREQRVAESKQHSWHARVEQLSELVAEAMQRPRLSK